MGTDEATAIKQPDDSRILHMELLRALSRDIVPVDFVSIAFPDQVVKQQKIKELQALMQNADTSLKTDRNYDNEQSQINALKREIEKYKITNKHLLIIVVDTFLELAKTKSWAICLRNNFIYLYNGEFWQSIDKSEFQNFLGSSAQKMGVEKFIAKYFAFKENLFKQFLSTAYLPMATSNRGVVLINLNNGTFEVTPQGIKLKEYNPDDFLTYQLPFNYDTSKNAPLFQEYLNKVLPEKELQDILAEYLGYVFIDSSNLKLEKALVLYGSGANGKSVFFDVVIALLGKENVSNFSLESLTDTNGYYRAKISNKLLNYASEISDKLETSYFKQLISGEPTQARLPYGEPFTITNYAKMIFNCNELPSRVEHNDAFFRRFLIIPFGVTIPEDEQDKELSKNIIDTELSGVFNWVLGGLDRLLSQRKFTESNIVRQQTAEFKKNTDNVFSFLEEEGYQKSVGDYILLQDLFNEFLRYCGNNNYKGLGKRKFSERLKNLGFEISRVGAGKTVFIAKEIVF